MTRWKNTSALVAVCSIGSKFSRARTYAANGSLRKPPWPGRCLDSTVLPVRLSTRLRHSNLSMQP